MHCHRRGGDQQLIQELKVGPLPQPTEHTPIKNPKYRDPIPYYARSTMADHELRLWEAFMRQELGKVENTIKLGTDGYAFSTNCEPKCLSWFPNVPGQWESGAHKMWVNFYKGLDGYYLHPIGLQVRVDALDMNVANWRVDYVWWRGQSFSSMEEFQRETQNPRFKVEKKKDPVNAHEPTLYSSMNYRGGPIPEEPRRGPQSFMPDGRRYKVNGHTIEWQGWRFNFGVRSAQGIHVNDARFRGERVLYELSIQELAAFYSGLSPLAKHTSFYDTFIHIGRETYQLFPGLDCPEHATFFDMVHYLGGKPHVYKNSVCVFEQDTGVPIRRHYESDHHGSYHWTQGMADNALVVRAITTAYNYEYIVDVVFHQQGGVEARTTLSGYILPTYYTGDAAEKPYGFEVFKDGVGNIHHHLINFKIDMDIGGTENRLEELKITPKREEDKAENSVIYQYNFERLQKEREKDACFEKTPPYLIQYNENRKNMFGNQKGYRIQPFMGSTILYGDDWKMSKSGGWTRYEVAFTKRKEEEESSSSVYASMDSFDPIMDFNSYIEDNENIVDEDLVAWVTMGTIHIPHTEDVPVVTTQNVRLTVHLTPFNYHDEDPSLASRDNIKVKPGASPDAPPQYSYAGVKSYTDCQPGTTSGAPVARAPGVISMAALAACFCLLLV